MYLKRLKEVTREHRPSLNGNGGKKRTDLFLFADTNEKFGWFSKRLPPSALCFSRLLISVFT